jgi:hypothetical protein
MHGSGVTRSELARKQALMSLDKLAKKLSDLDEVVCLLSLLTSVPDIHETNTDIVSLVSKRSEQTRLCESLILGGKSPLTEIIEKLKTNCPLILCTVSPHVIRQFSPESIASIIHCAIANNAPVNLLLESVRSLGRNNAQIDKSLSEVGLILRSLHAGNGGGDDQVIEALLDGLQGPRLNDEQVIVSVLNWAGTSLDQRLNNTMFEYLFAREYTDHIHKAVSNPFIERFLASRVGEDKKFAQVYAKLLVQYGKPNVAGDVLEKLAISGTEYDANDRLSLLEMANEIFSTSRRYMLLCVAKYVQLPLLDRLVDQRLATDTVESGLLSVGELYKIAVSHGFRDIQLACFLFSAVDDKELVKTWASLLFEDFSFWTRLGSGSIDKGLEKFLHRMQFISVETDSFAIWKRIEVVVAMVEYIHCLLSLSGRTSITRSYVAEFLKKEMRYSVNQIVEIYSKIVREMSSWISKIPRNSEFSGDVTPTTEYLEAYFADTLVQISEDALKLAGKGLNEKKLLSVLILLRNHIKGVHGGVESLISELSGNAGDENKASLPNVEGY